MQRTPFNNLQQISVDKHSVTVARHVIAPTNRKAATPTSPSGAALTPVSPQELNQQSSTTKPAQWVHIARNAGATATSTAAAAGTSGPPCGDGKCEPVTLAAESCATPPKQPTCGPESNSANFISTPNKAFSRDRLDAQIFDVSIVAHLSQQAVALRNEAILALNDCAPRLHGSGPLNDAVAASATTPLVVIGSFAASHSLEQSDVDLAVTVPYACRFADLSSRYYHAQRAGQFASPSRRGDTATTTSTTTTTNEQQPTLSDSEQAALKSDYAAARSWVELFEANIAAHPQLEIVSSAIAAYDLQPFRPHLMILRWGGRITLKVSFSHQRAAIALSRYSFQRMLDPSTNALIMILRAFVAEKRFSNDVINTPTLVLSVMAFINFHRVQTRAGSEYSCRKAQSTGSMLLGYLHVFSEGGAFDPATLQLEADHREGIVKRRSAAASLTRTSGGGGGGGGGGTPAPVVVDRLWRVHCRSLCNVQSQTASDLGLSVVVSPSGSDVEPINFAARCYQINTYRRALLVLYTQLCHAMGCTLPPQLSPTTVTFEDAMAQLPAATMHDANAFQFVHAIELIAPSLNSGFKGPMSRASTDLAAAARRELNQLRDWLARVH